MGQLNDSVVANEVTMADLALQVQILTPGLMVQSLIHRRALVDARSDPYILSSHRINAAGQAPHYLEKLKILRDDRIKLTN